MMQRLRESLAIQQDAARALRSAYQLLEGTHSRSVLTGKIERVLSRLRALEHSTREMLSEEERSMFVARPECWCGWCRPVAARGEVHLHVCRGAAS